MEEKLLLQDIESAQGKKIEYARAMEIHDLVDKAEAIKFEIKNVNAMSSQMCGKLMMNAKNHDNFNLNTITVNHSLAELVLKITRDILETELQFIENKIEEKLQ